MPSWPLTWSITPRHDMLKCHKPAGNGKKTRDYCTFTEEWSSTHCKGVHKWALKIQDVKVHEMKTLAESRDLYSLKTEIGGLTNCRSRLENCTDEGRPGITAFGTATKRKPTAECRLLSILLIILTT